MDQYRKFQVNFWAGRGLQLRSITEFVQARNSQEALGTAIIHLRAVEPKLEIRVDGISIQVCDDTENPPS